MKLRLLLIAGISLVISAALPPGAAAREVLSLNGEWEYRLAKDLSHPPRQGWKSTTVPSFLTSTTRDGAAWYRKRFDIPAGMLHRNIFLKFRGVKYRAKVILNGKVTGTHLGGFEPFEFGIDPSLVKEANNELLVAVGGWTSAAATPPDLSKLKPGEPVIAAARGSLIAPVGAHPLEFGIWQDVEVAAFGDARIEHVAVRTLVRQSRFIVRVGVRNLAGKQRRIFLRNAVFLKSEKVKELPQQQITLKPGEAKVVELSQEWVRPKMWWPDNPVLYRLRSILEADGEEIDSTDTRFGFRELWVDGYFCRLNGRRVNLYAAAISPSSFTRKAALEAYTRAKRANCTVVHLRGQPAPSVWYDVADEVGMMLVWESALWRGGNSYKLAADDFWRNARRHVEAQVKFHINRPSVVVWNVENELLLSSAGRDKSAAEKLAELGEHVKDLDPSRPLMYGGDGDVGGVADIINLHRPLGYPSRTDYPDAAYRLEEKMKPEPRTTDTFEWKRNKPLYIGRFLEMPSLRPDWYTLFFGNTAYQFPRKYRILGQAMARRYQIEAFRDSEVCGICACDPLPTEDDEFYQAVKESFDPAVFFIRERDHNFYGGERISRTVSIYNDKFPKSEMRIDWKLEAGEASSASSSDFATLERGEMGRVRAEFTLPEAAVLTPAGLVFKLFREGRPIRAGIQGCLVHPRRTLVTPAGCRLGLYDPAGKTAKFLKRQGVSFVEVSDARSVPEGTDLLVVGCFAFGGNAASRAASDLVQFVRKGGRAVVLEQNEYPAELLGLELEARPSSICFPRAPCHPILRGLKKADLRFWRRKHRLFSHGIKKPDQGNFRTIIDAGGPGGLARAALAEMHLRKGLLLLSQLEIVSRKKADPTGDLILERTLAYAAQAWAAVKPAGVIVTAESLNSLRAAGVVCEDIKGRLAGADLSRYSCLIFDGAPPEVARATKKIDGYVCSGGKVLIHGLGARQLDTARKLFRTKFELAPATEEPLLAAGSSPYLDGISNQEFYARTSMSVPCPPGGTSRRRVVEAASMKAERGAVFTPADRGFVRMESPCILSAQVNFPAAGRYRLVARVKATPADSWPRLMLSADGRNAAVIRPRGRNWHECAVCLNIGAGRRKVTISFDDAGWSAETGERKTVSLARLTCIPADPPDGFIALTKPPALCLVSREKGIYLLDQTRWADTASRYLSALLTNLGVEFK